MTVIHLHIALMDMCRLHGSWPHSQTVTAGLHLCTSARQALWCIQKWYSVTRL